MEQYYNKDDFNKEFEKSLELQRQFQLERMLKANLWSHLKEEFFYDDTVESMFTDDSVPVIIFKIDGNTMVVGYLHLNTTLYSNSIDDNNEIFKGLIQFNEEIRTLCSKKGVSDYKLSIVTTFKLSDNLESDYSDLPTDIGYWYLTKKINEQEKTQYGLTLDTDIIGMINGELLADFLIERSKNRMCDNTFWSCDICGGNQNTGCLYNDPTECPRFT